MKSRFKTSGALTPRHSLSLQTLLPHSLLVRGLIKFEHMYFAVTSN